MSLSNNTLKVPENHAGGFFEWETEPACCENIKNAIDDQFVFVSNFTEGGNNQCYMMPLAADGSLSRSKGVPIHFCPWCGNKIKARKLH